MTLQITTGATQYCLEVPAHRYWQGGRCVYYFALDLQSLDGLLPQRVDEDMIREANRRLTPSHAKNIQRYLESEKDWLLGAMLLGISPDAVEFYSYKDENGQPNINFGELRILASQRNTMRIFDGQHRRRAIGDLIMELAEGKESVVGRRDELLQSAVPIALYAEADIRSLRQMFSDAAKTKGIEANVVSVFDQRNAFNRAAKHLADESKLFGGRIETERTTVAAGGAYLLSINQLTADLKALEVGINGRVSGERNQGYLDNLDSLYLRCFDWADDFLPTAREEFEGLVAGEIEDSEIPEMRLGSLAFSATFIRILAGCYHEWNRQGYGDCIPLAKYVRRASLNPRGGYGTLLVDAGVMAPGDTSPVARRQEVQSAINYIVANARREAA